MNWEKGYTAKYYASFIDPITWRDTERFEIVGGGIKSSPTGLRQSADLDCVDYRQRTERWVRIWLDVKQDGSAEHVPLFTGLATAPEREIEGNLVSTPLTCYSVLKPAQDVRLPLGYYAPTGMSGALLVKNLLSETTPAPITIDGVSPVLAQYIIAEDGETPLTMVDKILTAINWRLRINGNGEISICPTASEISASFDPISNDMIEPKVKVTDDFYSCPNVFRAVMDDTSATARDESDRPLSIPSRGREVWAEEKNCKLNQNETLAEYAQRRLREEQMHYMVVDYDRRFHPNVAIGDIVRLHYPQHQIDGLFCVTSQSIELGYSARTSEEVVGL